MRVALVIQKLAGLRGGAERIVVELAHALEARGHAVTVITYEPTAGAPGYDMGDIPVVDLLPPLLRRTLGAVQRDRSVDDAESAVARRGNGVLMARLKWELSHGWFARRLAHWLREHEHDVVVGFLPPAIGAVGLAGERLAARRPRLIASTHNVPTRDFGPGGRWDPNPVARRENLRALELVDAVTVLQPEFVAQLPLAAQARAVVMPNPVERLAGPSGIGRRDLLVGVGRLTDVKRFDVLVEAFARIADQLSGWRLLIVGEGPERQRLEASLDRLGISDRCELPGATSSMAEVYDTARIMCHPARFEGFGLAVAEAILHGAPVVASRYCTGVDRLVEDGVTGLLVDDRDDPVSTFAAAILALATRPLDAASHAASAAELANRLAPDKIYDAWEDLLQG